MAGEKICFVCGITIGEGGYTIHQDVMMPVCENCKGTEKEKEKAKEMLDSLADGLICGCI